MPKNILLLILPTLFLTAGQVFSSPGAPNHLGVDLSTAVMSNDACIYAQAVRGDLWRGDTTVATADGSASCGGSEPDDGQAGGDLWYRYFAPSDGLFAARVHSNDFAPVVSIHTACPSAESNEISCHPGPSRAATYAGFEGESGQEYLIRVSAAADSGGFFSIQVGPAGMISGQVSDSASGMPLADVTVSFRGDLSSTVTDETGHYSGYLFPANYQVTANGPARYADEVYDGVYCPGLTNCGLGTTIEVLTNQRVDGVNFTLDIGGRISGRVRDEETSEGLANFPVKAWSRNSLLASSAMTDEAGFYTLEGLENWNYFVTTESDSEYLNELYNDLPCPGGGYVSRPSDDLFIGQCLPVSGFGITVQLGETTENVDFLLERRGGLSGAVTDTNMAPIPEIDIVVWDAEGQLQRTTTVETDGSYQIGGLEAGSYFVATSNRLNFVDQLHDGGSCDDIHSCDLLLATAVRVELGVTTSGVDFVLSKLGIIAGTVNDNTGSPLELVEVVVWDANGTRVAAESTDHLGRYKVEGLEPGTYFATAGVDSSYITELYNNLPCLGGPENGGCNPALGLPIKVVLDGVRAGIDFKLTLGGSISGHLRDAVSGESVGFSTVQVRNAVGRLVAVAATGDDGSYHAGGLPSGFFFVTTNTFSNYIDELYDDIVCFRGSNYRGSVDRGSDHRGPGMDCDPLNGTPIVVTVGENVPGIHFELQRPGSVQGTVTNEATGQPIRGILIRILDEEGNRVGFGLTDPEGLYEVTNLNAGAYFALTENQDGYRDELFNGILCPVDGPCSPAGATPIMVQTATTVAGVNFSLRLKQGIEGRVTEEASGRPLMGVAIDILQPHLQVARVFTNVDGRYSIGLDRGIYFVATANDLGAVDEIYNNVPCPDEPAIHQGCELLAGDPIAVGTSAIRRQVNFALSGDLPGPNSPTLSLNSDRFQVEVEWADGKGNTGRGQPVLLTADSGYFWFFNDTNVELVVKVLDGCFDPFNSFWVFASGLTDVEVRLSVTDTTTGDVREYQSPLGTPFEPVFDTSAFATCSE